jgi:hypothetical protein
MKSLIEFKKNNKKLAVSESPHPSQILVLLLNILM